MARTIRAGERGVDCSFARPPAARLLELGYTFLIGYDSMPPAAPAKNLTKVESDEYEAAGIEVFRVWEMSASRANLGAAYGTLDGTAAKNHAIARGDPTWRPLLAADDTNTTTGVLGALMAIGRAIRSAVMGSGGNIDAQEAYMRAFHAAYAPYEMGIYGDTDILERCRDIWRLAVLPNAWAWSGRSRAEAEAKARALGVQILQRKGFYIDNVWAVDPNEVIADFPTPIAPPPPEDPDMPNYYVTAGATAKFIGTPALVRWTGPGDDKLEASIARQLALGNLVQVDLAGTFALADSILDGPLPVGDSLHEWTGDEFANSAEIKARPPLGTVDTVARERCDALNMSVARLGQQLGDTKMNLAKAGA